VEKKIDAITVPVYRSNSDSLTGSNPLKDKSLAPGKTLAAIHLDRTEYHGLQGFPRRSVRSFFSCSILRKSLRNNMCMSLAPGEALACATRERHGPCTFSASCQLIAPRQELHLGSGPCAPFPNRTGCTFLRHVK